MRIAYFPHYGFIDFPCLDHINYLRRLVLISTRYYNYSVIVYICE